MMKTMLQSTPAGSRGSKRTGMVPSSKSMPLFRRCATKFCFILLAISFSLGVDALTLSQAKELLRKQKLLLPKAVNCENTIKALESKKVTTAAAETMKKKYLLQKTRELNRLLRQAGCQNVPGIAHKIAATKALMQRLRDRSKARYSKTPFHFPSVPKETLQVTKLKYCKGYYKKKYGEAVPRWVNQDTLVEAQGSRYWNKNNESLAQFFALFVKHKQKINHQAEVAAKRIKQKRDRRLKQIRREREKLLPTVKKIYEEHKMQMDPHNHSEFLKITHKWVNEDIEPSGDWEWLNYVNDDRYKFTVADYIEGLKKPPLIIPAGKPFDFMFDPEWSNPMDLVPEWSNPMGPMA